MKKISGLILVGLMLPLAYGQEEEARLKSITVSYGDSAFTSGLNISMLFTLNEKRDLELVGNSDRFYATLNFKVHRTLSLDATGGAFKKLPWIGPRIVYTPVKQVMALYWGGVSTGRIGALRAEAKSFCQQLSFYITPIESISVGFNVVKFDAYKTTHLPEVAYSYKLRKNLKLGVSATYDTVARNPLFCVSTSYTFAKK